MAKGMLSVPPSESEPPTHESEEPKGEEEEMSDEDWAFRRKLILKLTPLVLNGQWSNGRKPLSTPNEYAEVIVELADAILDAE